ncbi:MAG: ANTAR domain-containing response regulator [Lachnospiraceae bacterium]|jgi:AmiR/NasT family two-component response regulator
MVFDEKTYSVLIVSSMEKFTASITALLPSNRYFPLKSVTNIASAKRATLDREFDFIIINSPLPDDFGTRFAIEVCESRQSACTVFVKSELFDDVKEKLTPGGVFTMPKPTSSSAIKQALSFMASMRERMRKLDKKSTSIEEKMAEIRTVNRAKWVLIENLNMTEADAHRYIEKQAMDRCVAKKVIADSIIKTYSLNK